MHAAVHTVSGRQNALEDMHAGPVSKKQGVLPELCWMFVCAELGKVPEKVWLLRAQPHGCQCPPLYQMRLAGVLPPLHLSRLRPEVAIH